MIQLYSANTPNGFKASIMLEETGLPYQVTKLNLGAGDQRNPDYLKLNPNGRIPTIVDDETGQTVFESGAILIYLAEKSGQFLPSAKAARDTVIQWLFFQMAHVGPTFGQFFHFRYTASEPGDYAIERFKSETHRVYEVLDRRLGESPFLGGPVYSIADIATWPWARPIDAYEVEPGRFPNVERWIDTVGDRPAAQAGLGIPG